LQTINLVAEESALTGESVPVAKDARATLADDAPLGDRSTMLFVGTTVVRGKGRAIVVATGPHRARRLSALIGRPRHRTTPLEEKLDAFGKARPLGLPRALGASLRAGPSAGDAPGTSCSSRR
jgi:Ca2+-transporting ATPase